MKEREITQAENSVEYNSLIQSIGDLLHAARGKVARAVNSTMVETYWAVGKYIVEFQQGGKERATYGKELIARLSKDLTNRYGEGFNRNNLQYMRQLYVAFPICTTLSCKLSWSHYQEILKAEDSLEISFYVKQCEIENWSVRELRRQMKSMLFHRIALSKDKEEVLAIANKGIEVQQPEDIIRDPLVLEFTGLPQLAKYKESDLEKALIDNLQKFILELGKGFAFVDRQHRISIGGRNFYVDLVFYHYKLKCFVLIDLKRGEIEHGDIGQMNLYLNYFKQEENSEDDNEPIGIVLGAYKDKLLMEYALQGISNQLFVSRYQLYLPNREQLEKELKHLLETE